MRIIKFWLPVLFWAGVIFSLSALKVTPASEVYWQDFVVKKTAHVIEYGILFILLYRAFLNTSRWNKKQCAIWAILFVVLYGASDEYHQSFTPGREPKPRDVIIDGLGGGLAWIGLWRYLPRAPRRLKNLAKNLQVA